MSVTYREYETRDSAAVREMLNAVFASSPTSVDMWERWTRRDFTAALAFVDGRLAGAIPLRRRTLKVAPDAQIVVWIQHRVGVSEAHRGLGLGTGMQECARQILRTRGDAMLVISTSEKARPYAFYRQNGFQPVTYPRQLRLEPVTSDAADATREVQWLDRAAFLAQSEACLGVFESCYGACAGHAPRHAGWWREIDGSPLFDVIPGVSPLYAVVQSGGRLKGYLIAIERRGTAQVGELAAQNARKPIARALLRALRERGYSVVVKATPGGFLEHLACAEGAVIPPRLGHSNAIVAHILNIETAAAKVFRPLPELADTEVRVWTPEREGVLRKPANVRNTMLLEMDEFTLTRLLMRRLDVADAAAEERLTVSGSGSAALPALAKCFARAPWEFFEIEGL